MATTNQTLPAPADSPTQAASDLKEHGLTVIENVLSPAMLAELQQTTLRIAEQDIRRGRIEQAIASDVGTQRIWNLPSRDPIYWDLIEHPLALELVKSAMGWPVLLSNQFANIALPGSEEMTLHGDQWLLPEPWERPHQINVVWCVDDFTADNGATRVAPGTHVHQRAVDYETAVATPTVPVEAPAGSVIAFDGRLWHKTGANRTRDRRRTAIFCVYTLPVYLPQELWWLSLDPAVNQFGSDTLRTLFGLKWDFHFGRVNGRAFDLAQ